MNTKDSSANQVLEKSVSRRKPRRGERGFTLLELAVVGVVISLLIAIGLTYFTESLKMTKYVEATVTIGAIERALKDYYNQHNRFPSVRAEFNPADVSGGPALMDTKRTDGWKDIAFTPDGVYRFQYEWTPEIDGETGRVQAITIHAMVDTDGDGIFAHFYHRMLDGSRGFQVEETVHPE